MRQKSHCKCQIPKQEQRNEQTILLASYEEAYSVSHKVMVAQNLARIDCLDGAIRLKRSKQTEQNES
jgi:hypothetical protein